MERPLTPVATVRRAETRDVSLILAIEAAARPWAAHWSREAYLSTPDSGMCAWVAERAGEIVGFVLVRFVADEMEILNLAVAGTARRMGVGQGLVRAALEEAEGRGTSRVFLEVRESNAPALAFYDSLGFWPIGRRRGYYHDPAEDALTLACPLPGKA